MSTAVQIVDVLSRSSEADDLDFKAEFHNKSGDWLEIIKDIVAFGNSGGGTILIGVNDDGSASGADVSAICATDPADVTNKIYSYTGIQFHAFDIEKAEKQGKDICVISVRASRIPIVFTKVGNYEPTPGAKPKTAFNIGVVYFRHGAKSEPGNSEDLRQFVEREVEAIKHSWLSGIAKVVEAPPGSRVAIVAEKESTTTTESGTFQLTDDPAAPRIMALRLDQAYPHRQKELISAVNERLVGKKKINPHDAQCINVVYKVKETVKFCHTQKHASAQYSEQFVNWIVKSYQEDDKFFEKTREQADKIKGKK